MDDVKRFHIQNSKNKFKSVYSKMFNKKFNTKVWLSPTTGNVEKIELDQTTK